MKLELIGLLLASHAAAAELTVVNNTKETMRIASLRNKCSGDIVPETNPVYIKPGESRTFVKLPNVIHTYTICGGGFCSHTAIAIVANKTYVLDVTTDDGYISGKPKPDDWSTANTNCP